MNKNILARYLLAISLVILACNMVVEAEVTVIETGILSAEPGDVGDRIGAEVKSIDRDSEEGSIVEVEVPINPEKVNKVEVYDAFGKKYHSCLNQIYLKTMKTVVWG